MSEELRALISQLPGSSTGWGNVAQKVRADVHFWTRYQVSVHTRLLAQTHTLANPHPRAHMRSS